MVLEDPRRQIFLGDNITDCNTIIMPPPLIGGSIKRWCCLTSDVYLSVCRVHRT